MVTDSGGIDDKSFNASSWAGLTRAHEEFKFTVKPVFIESREQSDYETNLTDLASKGNHLIFAVGYLTEDALKKVAPKFPDVKFAIIDGNAPDLPNCISLKFREQEGCFLAGYLAGKMSKNKKIAYVGGMEGALMKRFEVGYISGARTAEPGIQVQVKYIGNWTDMPKGKDLGILLMSQGVDILFAAAGKGGEGVLRAVNEKGPGFYAIGVDADQDYMFPGRILTSMMKRVDNAVYETVADLYRGKWQPGERILGIREGGLSLSPMKYTRKDVPPKVLEDIEKLTRMIAEGKLIVPTTDEDLAKFVAPQI
jgi:basic membrane protein A